MKIVKTAKLEIINNSYDFSETIFIYKNALKFYIEVCEKEYNNYKDFQFSLEKRDYIEQITHKTSKRPEVKYDFGKDFHKFPSYFRRSVISEAIGIVSSHINRLNSWKEKQKSAKQNNKKFYEKPPKLNYEPKSFPTFFKGNMFLKNESIIQIKVFKDNDWKFIDIKLKSKELLSSNMYRFSNYSELSPSLFQKGKKFFLHFPFEKKVKLPEEKKIKLKNNTNTKVISVDLGLTNSAVCSCVCEDGTVLDRLFINQSKEKDHLNKLLNKISKIKRESGISRKNVKKWKKVSNLQKYIVQDTVNKIVDFAIKHEVYCIVFEHLGKIKGKKSIRQKLHHWNKNNIQKRTMNKAHSYGIRMARINPYNTSALAYDGSGKLERNDRKDLSTFPSGKVYHSDLNASYNIASRYFIRNILKPYSEKNKLKLQAKVPEILNRSLCTLSTLIKLQQVEI